MANTRNRKVDPNDADAKVAAFMRGTEMDKSPKKERYKEHRGEARQISKQYGRDLASVLKMRFVQGHTYEDIQKLTGLSRIIVMQMIEPFAVIMADPERVKAFKANEPHILDGVRMLMVQGMVDQLTDEVRRKKMDLSRLTFGYGLLFDKARLERGESTANILSLSDLVRAAHAKNIKDSEATDQAEEAQVIETSADAE